MVLAPWQWDSARPNKECPSGFMAPLYLSYLALFEKWAHSTRAPLIWCPKENAGDPTWFDVCLPLLLFFPLPWSQPPAHLFFFFSSKIHSYILSFQDLFGNYPFSPWSCFHCYWFIRLMDVMAEDRLAYTSSEKRTVSKLMNHISVKCVWGQEPCWALRTCRSHPESLVSMPIDKYTIPWGL